MERWKATVIWIRYDTIRCDTMRHDMGYDTIRSDPMSEWNKYDGVTMRSQDMER